MLTEILSMYPWWYPYPYQCHPYLSISYHTYPTTVLRHPSSREGDDVKARYSLVLVSDQNSYPYSTRYYKDYTCTKRCNDDEEICKKYIPDLLLKRWVYSYGSQGTDLVAPSPTIVAALRLALTSCLVLFSRGISTYKTDLGISYYIPSKANISEFSMKKIIAQSKCIHCHYKLSTLNCAIETPN